MQELKFYPHGTGPDQQTATFTKMKENLILKIQSEFVNGIDIAESIRKGAILYLSKDIMIKRISTEYEPRRADLAFPNHSLQGVPTGRPYMEHCRAP